MSHESDFWPLTMANTRRIRTNVELPFGLEERVGVDVRRTQAMMQLGGIRHLKLQSEEGETSKVSGIVVGVDRQGGAVSGGIRSETVPVSTSKAEFTRGQKWRKQATWKDIKVTLNVEEAKRRFLDEGGDVRRPERWAQHVDKAVRGAVVSQGVRHLVDTSTYEKVLFGIAYAGGIATAGGVGLGDIIFHTAKPHPPTIEGIVGQFILIGAFWSVWDLLSFGPERPGEGRRISLFVGTEPDRALALGIMAALGPVAKVLK